MMMMMMMMIAQIFSPRMIADTYLSLQYGKRFLIVNDFRKAFDRVWQKGSWVLLHHYGIHPKLIPLVFDMAELKQMHRVRIMGRDER
ncbi:hypothetical protein DPMN_006646 [Dreissena polymorpha]|uniref:Reverse transcriptase domain-containing protein n=1 Tax=Dreissena polymorpha TaxID=45954 RepID=A0A9D4MWX2_DREPO|nr:hypothetical protein DPMN_006646 [Dreissena polymorpha]